MKVKSKVKKGKHQIKLTFDNDEEIIDMFHRLNASPNDVKELNNTSYQFVRDADLEDKLYHIDVWHVIQHILREKGLYSLKPIKNKNYIEK